MFSSQNFNSIIPIPARETVECVIFRENTGVQIQFTSNHNFWNERCGANGGVRAHLHMVNADFPFYCRSLTSKWCSVMSNRFKYNAKRLLLQQVRLVLIRAALNFKLTHLLHNVGKQIMQINVSSNITLL